MKLRLDPADEQFRNEVRAYLRETLPANIIRRTRIGMHPPHEEDRRWWNRVLNDKGWAGYGWPKEHGGTGWSATQKHIFEMECRMAGAPELRWQGLRLFGPVLYTFGTPEQKARYLPRILDGSEMWGQGFSEPGAGSDLASLKTSAVLDGDHYIINGQKLWMSEGQFAEMGFFLVRTDATVKPQRGISMIIIDMKAPGITVRETALLNGAAPTCEVFLDNVRVPKENLVGAPGTGWDQAKFLLTNERTSSAEIEKSTADLRRIRLIAAAEQKNGRPLLEDPEFSRRLTQLELEVEALEWSVLRVLCDAPSNFSTAACASVLKVRGSVLQQHITDLALDALGQRGLRFYSREDGFADADNDPLWPDYVPGVVGDMLYTRVFTIYGGAMEVQKNIIAKIAFGF